MSAIIKNGIIKNETMFCFICRSRMPGSRTKRAKKDERMRALVRTHTKPMFQLAPNPRFDWQRHVRGGNSQNDQMTIERLVQKRRLPMSASMVGIDEDNEQLIADLVEWGILPIAALECNDPLTVYKKKLPRALNRILEMDRARVRRSGTVAARRVRQASLAPTEIYEGSPTESYFSSSDAESLASTLIIE